MSITQIELESITGIELDGVTGGQNTTKGTAGLSVSPTGVTVNGSLEKNRTDKGYAIDAVKKACADKTNTWGNMLTGNRAAAAGACVLKNMPK